MLPIAGRRYSKNPLRLPLNPGGESVIHDLLSVLVPPSRRGD